MGDARQPVIYAGGGILKARAGGSAEELVDLTGFPVVTTLMARGAFPDDHELCLGMPGMHGNYTAVTAMQKADLLIALGSRFDDRVTGKSVRSRPTPRSSTSTSIPPSSARCDAPTCRSSATAAS
jgi:acetolactate synthase-1/2/3 large subunit